MVRNAASRSWVTIEPAGLPFPRAARVITSSMPRSGMIVLTGRHTDDTLFTGR
jgi:hypothetical protein